MPVVSKELNPESLVLETSTQPFDRKAICTHSLSICAFDGRDKLNVSNDK